MLAYVHFWSHFRWGFVKVCYLEVMVVVEDGYKSVSGSFPWQPIPKFLTVPPISDGSLVQSFILVGSSSTQLASPLARTPSVLPLPRCPLVS